MGEVEATEVIVGLMLILLGWLHMRQSDLAKKLDDKVDHSHFAEFRTDLKEILKTVTKLEIENARWQGRSESQQESNKPDRS